MRANKIVQAIKNWETNGVIDAATATRLREFEKEKTRPDFLRLLFSLGGFALALGVITLVAANWQDFPVSVKLGMHILLNLGLGFAAWKLYEQKPFTREVLLLVLSGSTLALIAHIGQSFQIEGSLSGMLGWWLLLVTPFTFMAVNNPLHRTLWAIGFTVFSGSLFTDYVEVLTAKGTDFRMYGVLIWAYVGFFFAAPLWLARVRVAIPEWCGDVLHRICTVILIVGVSAAQIIWRASTFPDSGGFISFGHEIVKLRESMLCGTVAGILIFAVIGYFSYRRSPGLAEKHKAYFFTTLPLLCGLPVLFEHPAFDLVGALFFVGIWLYLAWLAVLFQNKALFDAAAIVISLRLFIVTVEVFGTLMLTGIGLIAAGFVLIGLGWLCQRAMLWAKRSIPKKALSS